MIVEKLIVACSSAALIKSFYIVSHRDNDDLLDYKPLSNDNSLSRKIMYWLSQCTYQVNSMILFAYISKIFKKREMSNIVLKIGFANLCTVSILYWYLIAPNRSFQDILVYNTMYNHLFVLPLCGYDVFQNTNLLFTMNDLKYTCSYFICATLSNIINYKIRNVWTYGLFKFVNPFEDYSGYMYFIGTISISIMSHVIIGKLKANYF